MKLMSGDRVPATGDRTGASAVSNRIRVGGGAVGADEGIPAGIEAIRLCVDVEECIMGSSFAVLRLMVDGGTVDFNFPCGEVALEVGNVIQGVPETELYVGEDLE